MTKDSSQIDRIVRMVVERLRNREAGHGGVLELAGKIITLQDVESRLEGVRRIRISDSALLTPAVKDELRRAGVAVERGQQASGNVQPKTLSANQPDGSKTIHVVATANLSRKLNLIARELNVVLHPSDDANCPVLVDSAMGAHAQSRWVWWTSTPFAASRTMVEKGSTVRVVSLAEFADLTRAIDEVQPNVIVLDEKRWSAFQVARLVKTWVKL